MEAVIQRSHNVLQVKCPTLLIARKLQTLVSACDKSARFVDYGKSLETKPQVQWLIKVFSYVKYPWEGLIPLGTYSCRRKIKLNACTRVRLRSVNNQGHQEIKTRRGIQLFCQSFSPSHYVKFIDQFHAPSCFLKDRTQVPTEQQVVWDVVLI